MLPDPQMSVFANSVLDLDRANVFVDAVYPLFGMTESTCVP